MSSKTPIIRVLLVSCAAIFLFIETNARAQCAGCVDCVWWPGWYCVPGPPPYSSCMNLDKDRACFLLGDCCSSGAQHVGWLTQITTWHVDVATLDSFSDVVPAPTLNDIRFEISVRTGVSLEDVELRGRGVMAGGGSKLILPNSALSIAEGLTSYTARIGLGIPTQVRVCTYDDFNTAPTILTEQTIPDETSVLLLTVDNTSDQKVVLAVRVRTMEPNVFEATLVDQQLDFEEEVQQLLVTPLLGMSLQSVTNTCAW